MTINNTFKLIIAIVISELAGIIGSVFTISAIPNWYSTLVKPALNPPAWVFGPVWTTLYALMGIAAFLVWKQWDQGSPSTKLRVKTALAIFGLQLFLNAIWSIIFFGFRSPGWALVDIVLLWFAIVWTMVVFYKISPPSSSWRTTEGHGKQAAYLLAPYLLWISFAAYLNYSIWVLN